MASTFPVGSLASPSSRVASDKKFESMLSSAFISSFSFSKTPNVALRPGHRSLRICAMGEGLHSNKDGSSIKKLQFNDVNKLADLVGVATFGPKGRNIGAKLVTKAAGDGEGATAKSTKVRRPRFKIIRRLGPLPGLTSKSPKGGSDRKRDGRPVKKSQYRIRLEEKQKLRFHYGVNERQLLNYVRLAGKAKGSTGQVLLQLLEMRLDNIIFRLGMALTIPQARQFVNHRHILVNGHIVDIPSYRCKPTDVITVKDDKDSKKLIKTCLDAPPALELPGHLTVQPIEYKGLVNQVTDRKWVGLNVNELLVVEYYSRQA